MMTLAKTILCIPIILSLLRSGMFLKEFTATHNGQFAYACLEDFGMGVLFLAIIIVY